MESPGSLQTPVACAARRQEQLDTMGNGGVPPPWGAGVTMGRAAAAALPDIVRPDQDRPASSDGARYANSDDGSLGVFGRRSTYHYMNYGSALPVAMVRSQEVEPMGGKPNNGQTGKKWWRKVDDASGNSNSMTPSTASSAPSSSSTSAKCGKCQKVGHETERCPDHQCHGCGGKGHSSELCPNLQ